jgi:hypothetical protein
MLLLKEPLPVLLHALLLDALAALLSCPAM